MSTTKTKTVLVLRTCNADMTSYGGFRWPKRGPVKAPDWVPDDNCGHGLHGLLWGEGDGTLLDWSDTAKWLVVAVATADIRYLGGKCKFPGGAVKYCGDMHGATAYLAAHGLPQGTRVEGGTATAGDKGTATAGHSGTATAGDRGTATAGGSGTATVGDYGTATAGYGGTATAGYSGTATAGDYGTATAGDKGTATAGHSGTATAGDRGTATAGGSGTATVGDYGTATAGYGGTATAGNRGTATAGDYGTATAGDEGVLILRWWDPSHGRYYIAIAAVGENGIKPNVAYRLNKNHEFEEDDR